MRWMPHPASPAPRDRRRVVSEHERWACPSPIGSDCCLECGEPWPCRAWLQAECAGLRPRLDRALRRAWRYRRDLAELHQYHADYVEHSLASHRAMVETVDELRAALAWYGGHDWACGYPTAASGESLEPICICGLSAALETK